MAKNVVSREKLAEFAAAYRSGTEIDNKEAVVQYLSGLGKKTVQLVSEIPELLLFMADNGMIPIADIDKYLFEVSWIDYPEVIESLLRYKKNPPEIQTKAIAEQQEAKAADPKNDWVTEKKEDGTLRLVSYKGTDVDIRIPTKIGKSMVTTIGAAAFTPDKPRLKKEMAELRKKIRSVEIPEGITSIERDTSDNWDHVGAFQSCSALKELRIPNSIKTLPAKLFQKSGISKIILPDDLEVIESGAFNECNKLKSISLPGHIKELQGTLFSGSALEEFLWEKNDGTTELPYYVFGWCTQLRKVVLPDSLTKIGEHAFAGCINLKELTIPSAVSVIEKCAFSGCEKLEELHVPDGVWEINEGTFYGCKKLKQLYLPASVEKIEPGNRARYLDTRTFCECEMLTIYAPAGSYAESFALENRIRFTAI